MDPEAAAELRVALEGRKAAMQRFIDGMSGMLRPALDPNHALALYLALTLREVYTELVDVAKWSPDEYEAWLAAALKQQLLADS